MHVAEVKTSSYAISKPDVVAASNRIRPLLTASPLVRLEALSHLVGQDVLCKLDTALPTGAFKVRGARPILFWRSLSKAAQRELLHWGYWAQGFKRASRRKLSHLCDPSRR